MEIRLVNIWRCNKLEVKIKDITGALLALLACEPYRDCREFLLLISFVKQYYCKWGK